MQLVEVPSTTLLTPGVIQEGHAEVVTLLLRASADADEAKPHGYIPLALGAKVSSSGGKVVCFLWLTHHAFP